MTILKMNEHKNWFLLPLVVLVTLLVLDGSTAFQRPPDHISFPTQTLSPTVFSLLSSSYSSIEPTEEFYYHLPLPEFQLTLMIMKYSRQFGVPYHISLGLALEESRGDPYARSDNGWKLVRGKKISLGVDEGLFQHNSRNHTWFRDQFNHGVEFSPYDAEINTRIALQYLVYLYQRFGSWEKALWYYNGGTMTPTKKTQNYSRRIVTGVSLTLQ